MVKIQGVAPIYAFFREIPGKSLKTHGPFQSPHFLNFSDFAKGGIPQACFN